MNVYLSKLCSRGIIDVNNNNVASQFIECDRCIMLINYKKIMYNLKIDMLTKSIIKERYKY